MNENSLMIHFALWVDRHFVDNLTIGPPVISSIRRHCPGAFLDCHMMVSDPSKWVEAVSLAGGSQFTFHLESLPDCSHVPPLITKIKGHGMRVGIAIRPSTPLRALHPSIIEQVDMVLVMTVEPGFGGQPLRRDCLDKVRVLRQQYGQLDVQVDGGIMMDNLAEVVEAGANVVVAGTLILASPDPRLTIHQMRQVINKSL